MKKVFLTLLVVLFAAVVIAGTKTEISPKTLPACMKEWVKKNLPGYSFDKAYKIESTNAKGEVVIAYIARAAKGKVYQWIESDPDCKQVRKLADKEATEAVSSKPEAK